MRQGAESYSVKQVDLGGCRGFSALYLTPGVVRNLAISKQRSGLWPWLLTRVFVIYGVPQTHT